MTVELMALAAHAIHIAKAYLIKNLSVLRSAFILLNSLRCERSDIYDNLAQRSEPA